MSSDDDFAPPPIPDGVTLSRAGKDVLPITTRVQILDDDDDDDNNDDAVDGDDSSSSEGVIGPTRADLQPEPPRVTVIDEAEEEDELSFETDLVPPEIPYTEVHDRPIESFPLFMHTAPGEGEENDDIAAIQELLEEGPPEERADNFKTQGNKCLARGYKYWDDAITFYTRALEVGCQDAQRNSVYLSNRAAVEILKKNFGRAAQDSVAAVKLDERNVKAMYRAALSYYEVRRLDESLQYLRKCMKLTKGKKVLELEKKIAKAMRLQNAKEERKNKNMEDAADTMMKISQHVVSRGYRISDDDVYLTRLRMKDCGADYSLLDVPDRRTGKPKTHLICPVVIVYPQGRTSDFVKEFSEELFMADLLGMMFGKEHPGMDWDSQGWYTNDQLHNLMIYVKTNDVFDTYKKQSWVKVKLSMTLGEAMRIHKDYVVPVVPTFFVFHIKWKDVFFGPEIQRLYGSVVKRDQV